MKKEGYIVVSIIIIVLVLHLTTDIFKRCPASCSDRNPCTMDYCSEETGFKCAYDLIYECCGNNICEKVMNETEVTCPQDCPYCNDSDPCTEDFFSYSLERCLSEKKIPCCGNGFCDVTESYVSCFADCPLNGFIEIKTSHISNPQAYPDTGQRTFYHIRNCLSDDITLIQLVGYYDGKQGREITKKLLEDFEGSEEISPVITADSCYNPITYIIKTTIVKNDSEVFRSRVYFRFEYNGEIYEVFSNEKLAIARSTQEFSARDLAIYEVSNNNIRKV